MINNLNINIFCFEGLESNSEKKLFRTLDKDKTWRELLNQQGILKITSHGLDLKTNFRKNYTNLEIKINRAKMSPNDNLEINNKLYILLDRDDINQEKLLHKFLKEKIEKIKGILSENYQLSLLLYPKSRNFEYLVCCFLESNRHLNSLTKSKCLTLIKKKGIDLQRDIKEDNNRCFLKKSGLETKVLWSNLKDNLLQHHQDEDFQKEIEQLQKELKINVISFAELFNLI